MQQKLVSRQGKGIFCSHIKSQPILRQKPSDKQNDRRGQNNEIQVQISREAYLKTGKEVLICLNHLNR